VIIFLTNAIKPPTAFATGVPRVSEKETYQKALPESNAKAYVCPLFIMELHEYTKNYRAFEM